MRKWRKPKKINKMQHNPVSHPKHYTSHSSGTECIVIASKMSFTLGNAFKYLFRCDHKGYPKQDLEKALFYLRYELGLREALPRWKRLWSEDDDFDATFDGSEDFMWMIAFESRYSGHMAAALERVYAASVLGRSVRPLRSAISSVERMIKIQEWKEAQ